MKKVNLVTVGIALVILVIAGMPKIGLSEPVNGVCGSAAKGKPISQAPTDGLCTLGKPSAVTSGCINGTWSWLCFGLDGGDPAFCYAAALTTCGSANGQSFSTAPTTNLCICGNAGSVAESGNYWKWTCTLGNTVVSCSATDTAPFYNGVCGPAAYGPLSQAPTTNLCLVGTPSAVTGGCSSGAWLWQCSGSYGSVPATCYVPTLSACGSANGQSFSTAPTTNLCTCGNAGSVTEGRTSWNWTCSAQGSTAVSCSATNTAPFYNGVCGPAAYGPLSQAPTTNLCLVGTPSAVTGGCSSGAWLWQCSGSYGSVPATCYVPTLSACGSANGQSFSTAPTTNLCTCSTPTPVTLIESAWTWSCTGSMGGTPANCIAYLPDVDSGIFSTAIYWNTSANESISNGGCSLASTTCCGNSNSYTTIPITITDTHIDMSYAEGYACDITFTINSDPYSPHRPFCVVTPVSGRFASGESAYAMVDVNTPNNGTPTQNNYLVNVIVPGCFNSTCIAQGGINIICTH